jgi:hypothetical protein
VTFKAAIIGFSPKSPEEKKIDVPADETLEQKATRVLDPSVNSLSSSLEHYFGVKRMALEGWSVFDHQIDFIELYRAKSMAIQSSFTQEVKNMPQTSPVPGPGTFLPFGLLL